MVPSQFSMPPLGRSDTTVLLFPGALGDFLCFSEALSGLRRASESPILVVARPAWTTLLPPGDFGSRSIDSRAVGQLFANGSIDEALHAFGGAGAIYSWTGKGVPRFEETLRRLGARHHAVFGFRDFAPGEHSAEYYSRCIGVSPQPPPVDVPPSALAWAESRLRDLRAPVLAVHPGSGSPRKNWQGFAALAHAWRQRGSAVEIRGPAEESAPPLDVDLVIRDCLPRVAAVLQTSALFAGNDSGVTHLAGAVGARGVAVFGDGACAHWRPRSRAIRVFEASPACDRCDTAGICTHRASVESVLAELGRAADQTWQLGQ